jgi:bisphosphoglycerate-independent phosphoglycerate mutase (AlkP superfamily)
VVGHTGVGAATIEALTVLDGCLARVVGARGPSGARSPGPGALLAVAADHGNADMTPRRGRPRGDSAPLNPVLSLGSVARPRAHAPRRVLADVAPTLLEFAGLPPWEHDRTPVL